MQPPTPSPVPGAFYEGRAVITFDYAATRALGAPYWRVLEPFTLFLNAYRTQWVQVPAGYLTDGASVPRAFWSFVDRWDWYAPAVIVHDLLCEYLQVTTSSGPLRISRERCDQILDLAMGVLEPDMGFAATPSADRETIYKAVCLYRRMSGIDHPTNTPQKRALEAQGSVQL
ncbi:MULTISPECIES: DUF1353 domain-containing protein [unclassified Pseudomonas]|uniref:DUF1353 domain-containing protein n=1 Tax=unclassified Pseudomonas TaxID=196821 RepID=UPI00131E1AD5|nr:MULTISPECIES: DUF1353 domain-containing protein [unclassified Pseudomonas]